MDSGYRSMFTSFEGVFNRPPPCIVVQFETPQALANLSPGLERSENPGSSNCNYWNPKKGSAVGEPFPGSIKLFNSYPGLSLPDILDRTANTSWCNAAMSLRNSSMVRAPANSPALSASRPMKKLANAAVI